jgi:hypothetical protein
MAAMASNERLQEIRQECGRLIAMAMDDDCTEQYNSLLNEFLSLGGSPSDMIIKIGEAQFDFVRPGGRNDKSTQGPHDMHPIEGGARLDFDYLEQFMVDSFLAVGVPLKEARISANVLIEADKRGIDSHGIGRLKVV